MEVILSVLGAFTAPRIAAELSKKGMLKKIFMSKAHPYKIHLPKNKVEQMSSFYYFGHFLKYTIFPNTAWYWTSKVFDSLVSKNDLQCDIFHGFSGHSLLSMDIARSHGAKLIIDMGAPHPDIDIPLKKKQFKKFGYNYIPDFRLYKRQIKEYEKTDYILVPSSFVYDSFISNGVDSGKMLLIQYGVDLNKFHIQPIAEKYDKFRIVYVSGLEIIRGVPYLLKAFKDLKMKNAELVLIGRMSKKLKNVISRYKTDYTYLGYIDHDKLVKKYNEASIFVCPSLSEGGPLVVYEAMACGLPIITTKNTGAPITNGKEGFIIPAGNVASLKDKIQYFYDNPSEIRRMGNNAYKTIQMYSWEKYGHNVLKMYQDITN